MLFNKIHEEMCPLRTESCLMGPEATTHRGCLRLSHPTGPVNRAKPGTSRPACLAPNPDVLLCRCIYSCCWDKPAPTWLLKTIGIRSLVVQEVAGPKPVSPAGVGVGMAPREAQGRPSLFLLQCTSSIRQEHHLASAPSSSSHRLPSVVTAPSAVFLQGPSGWMLEGHLPISTS